MPDTHSAVEIRFVLTPRLQEACRKYNAALLKSNPAREEIMQAAKAKLDSRQDTTATISFAGVKALSQHLQSDPANGKDIWVHQLLRGSRLHLEAPPTKPRNPELVARLDKIKKQLEEQEYKRMTAGVNVRMRGIPAHNSVGDDLLFPAVPGVRTGQAPGFGSVKQEMGAVSQQISVIINILFSALGVGFAVSYASYTLTPYIGYRVLLGLGSAVLIVLAETWLFVFAGTRGQKKRLNIGGKPSSTTTRQSVASEQTVSEQKS